MLCALLFALQAKGQDESVDKQALVTRDDAELVLPQHSNWRAFVYDRVSGECWIAGWSYGPQRLGPRPPAGTIDVGDLELVAVGYTRDKTLGYTRDEMVVAAKEEQERFGHESISVFEVDLYDKFVSDGVWESKTTLRKRFDVDTVAKKAIEARRTIAGELKAKLDAATFEVAKVHIEALDNHDGPVTVFLGIEDITSLFRGVLVVPTNGSAPRFFPGSWVSSFAVSLGLVLVMASENDPSKINVIQRIDGRWVHQRTISLPKGAVLQSAHGTAGALFTVSGDETGVWKVSFYYDGVKRTEMSTPVEKMAFSQGAVYWLDGKTVNISYSTLWD
ncbi:MAG: hypothetical protein IH945_12750 [Armatimonadetes bacterium]|nr:hypothetical protein [Armatimonadota bacterium]